MNPESPTRRDVLCVLAAGTAATCLMPLSGCGPSGLISAGNISELTLGELVAVADQAVAIGLDSGGVYAMTTICTHLQCDISELGSISATELRCDCHDSVFDGAGAVLEGPATAPLDFFAVTVDEDGAITIDAETVVDATERQPI
jgi:Rieske Fe-S protein